MNKQKWYHHRNVLFTTGIIIFCLVICSYLFRYLYDNAIIYDTYTWFQSNILKETYNLDQHYWKLYCHNNNVTIKSITAKVKAETKEKQIQYCPTKLRDILSVVANQHRHVMCSMNNLSSNSGTSLNSRFCQETDSNNFHLSPILRKYTNRTNLSSSSFSTSSSLQKNQKYIIWSCMQSSGVCGGLADKIKGILTTYILSILTNRVLLINWSEAPLIFDYTSFNWTINLVEFSIGKSVRILNPAFIEYDLSNYDQDVDILVMPEGSSYILPMLLHDPKYSSWKEILYENLGLDGKFSFGCLSSHIFFPSDAVISEYLGLSHYLTESGTVSVSIHARMGDKELHGYKASAKDNLHTMKYLIDIWARIETARNHGCAILQHRLDNKKYQLNQHQNQHNSNTTSSSATSSGRSSISSTLIGAQSTAEPSVRILFLSDSKWLRSTIALKYKHGLYCNTISTRSAHNYTRNLKQNDNYKVSVVVPPGSPSHIDVAAKKHSKNDIDTKQGAAAEKEHAYISSVGEWWLMSLCDVVMVEGVRSGFSSSAYAFGMHLGMDSFGHVFKSPGESGLPYLR